MELLSNKPSASLRNVIESIDSYFSILQHSLMQRSEQKLWRQDVYHTGIMEKAEQIKAKGEKVVKKTGDDKSGMHETESSHKVKEVIKSMLCTDIISLNRSISKHSVISTVNPITFWSSIK